MDIREALNESIESLDAESALAESEQEIITDELEGSQEDSQQQEGEQGSETEEQGYEKEGSAASEGDVNSAEHQAAGEADPHQQEQDTSKNSIKAPVNWSPQEREQWSKIPRNLQDKIVAREKEMADTMANTKAARQTHEQFGKIAQSFAPIMAAEGFSHPMEAMQAAFGVMTTMRMGTPQQKAQEIARLIGQYGVDIEALDNVLVSGAPAQQGGQQLNPQSAQLEQMLNERLAPVNQLMQQVQQAQQAQIQQRNVQANNEVAKFGETHEFLPDVRDAMADIIEMGAKRGVNISLEDAYSRACAAHPEISQVMRQREQDALIKGEQADLSNKRAAASSISGRQLGTGGGGQGNMSLRDSIAAAFDDAANS